MRIVALIIILSLNPCKTPSDRGHSYTKLANLLSHSY
jgi:hypothetical protein